MQFTQMRKKIIGIVLLVCLIVGIGTIVTMICLENSHNSNKESKGHVSSYVDQLGDLVDQGGTNNKVYLIDFSKYDGDNTDPSAFFTAEVEMESTYTLSFDYCVVGESLGTTCVNAANEWGMGSEVKFNHDPLMGKGTFTETFTADYPFVHVTFQTFIPKGTPKLYVWNLSLIKEGSDNNQIRGVGIGDFQGPMVDSNLISIANVDPDTLKGTRVVMEKNPVCLFDFTKYSGKNECPGGSLETSVEMGETYTFSFDYCVIGETAGVTCINAANEWGMGSDVKFDSAPLLGKRKYSVTFKADYPTIYPVIQAYIPQGKAEVYVWNISLIKKGTKENKYEKIALGQFQGDMATDKLVSFTKVKPDTLKPTTEVTIDADGIINVSNNVASNTWLFDFEKYNGKEETPGAMFSLDVEHGQNYTFSFDYCVVGEATGITCVNAANEWNMGSKVKFDSNPLVGKGNYKVNFKADYPQVLPVFQAHIPNGKAKLYIWNLKLIKSGTDGNILKSVGFNRFQGAMKDKNLVIPTKINTSRLEPTVKIKAYIGGTTWLMDFTNYKGKDKTPGAMFSMDVEKGSKYKFSFKYCVVGKTTATTMVNAASEWGMGSKVKFDSNPLVGKGTYETEFTADYPQVLPVFQSHIPNGKPKLYVWDIKLEKVGTKANMLSDVSFAKFQGALVKKGLLSLSDVNTKKLKPTVKEIKPISGNTWLIDFSRYNGKEENPNLFFSNNVKKGKRYSLSFDYCVVGKSTGTTVVNAANEWGMGSKVKFDSTPLVGKGKYKVSFKADKNEIMPVFQTNTPQGKPKLYIWNVKLVQKGSKKNIMKKEMSSKFQGIMTERGLVKSTKISTKKLKPTVKEIKPIAGNTWLIDFSRYSGKEENPNVYFSTDVKKGKTYTLSFDYCIVGKSTGTTVVNAASEWKKDSKVKFDSNPLVGKGKYTTSFKADQNEVIPVFQTHIPNGKPKVYIWNVNLVQKGSKKNLMKKEMSSKFRGVMAEEGLVTSTNVNTKNLKPTVTTRPLEIAGNTWLIDFSQYKGKNEDPGVNITLDVEKGTKYTFSFSYCVIGETRSTTIINAAKEWGLGSKVKFDDNNLNGKKTYTTTFTADMVNVIPVFQTHIPNGKPKLYVWDIKLIKVGTDTNLLKGVSSTKFQGDMVDAGLIKATDENTAALIPTVTKEDPKIANEVCLFDFSGYTGSEQDITAGFGFEVEKNIKYKFSFDYCVVGSTSATTIINALNEWGLGSNVKFENNQLKGKGTYEYEFTADNTSIYPVFQTHIPLGAPKLYVWNLKLLKDGSSENLMRDVRLSAFAGTLADAGLVSVTDINPDQLTAKE